MASGIIDRTGKILDSNLVGLVEPAKFVVLNAVELLKKVASEYPYQNDNQKKQIIIKLDNEFRLKGDENLLIIAIFNLIKNTFDNFSDANLTITIGLRKGSNCNVIYVYNSIYVAKEKLDLLLSDGGGLSNCFKILRSFGGQIKTRAEEGKYNEFALLFPLVKEEEQLIKSSILTSHPINSVKAEGEKTIKILLVDDVDTNLIMIKSLFEKYFDASCDLVADGVEAVKRVRENNYNIVLIDIKMPIMDGVSAAREIRKFNKEIPMITYSTSITDVKKEEIKEAGFNDFLPWPLRHNILLRTIAKWLMIKNYWFEDRQPTEERIAESFRDKNLLLVDDQDLNRVLVASHLVKNYDILVDQASNGKEAVEKFIAKAKSGDPYDLVFMDVKMPIMDGFEATKQIRKYQEENKAQQNVPIVAITGDGDRDSVNKIFASGMDDYFIKGDNYDNITKIIMLWTHIIGENNIYNEKISIAKESLQSGIINKSYGDLLPQIIPIFIKDGQALIDDMKKAKEENDINKLSFSAHALKGVCGNMKAERLYKLCSYISDLAKQNKWPSDSDWMNEVEKAFVDTKEELKKYQA